MHASEVPNITGASDGVDFHVGCFEGRGEIESFKETGRRLLPPIYWISQTECQVVRQECAWYESRRNYSRC